MWAASLSPPQFLAPEEALALPLPPPQCLLLLAAATTALARVVVAPQPTPPTTQHHPQTTTTTTLLRNPAPKNVASGWRTGSAKINPS